MFFADLTKVIPNCHQTFPFILFLAMHSMHI